MSEVDPDLLAQFNALTEQAADYRRHSYGSVSNPGQRNEEGRPYLALLSSHLLQIQAMVEDHPELRDEYRKWRSLYSTFTSD